MNESTAVASASTPSVANSKFGAKSPDSKTPGAKQGRARRAWMVSAPGGLPLLVGLMAFVLYACNISSTVTYGSDCGEFAAMAFKLGIGHPTGNVFYCLLARTWISLLPWGEVAWRLNLLSALGGATTVGLICATLGRVLDKRLDASSENDSARDDSSFESSLPESASPESASASWAVAGAGLLLAGQLFFFGPSVIINVHILLAALVALLIYCAVRWHQSVQQNLADWRWIYSMAILAGIALNTHMSWVFAFPGLLTLSVLKHRGVFGTRREWWRRMASLFGFALASYALTLYLPLRSSLFPAPPAGYWWPLDWTHPATLGNWLAHIRAHQYAFLFLQPTPVEIFGHHAIIKWFASPPSAIPGKLLDLGTQMVAQWLWALLLMPLGAAALWKRDRTLGLSLLLIAVVNLGFEINYNVPVGELANFLFPMYLVMTLWLGAGIQAVLQAALRIGARWDKSSTRKGVASRWQWRLGTLAKLAVPATIAVQWMLSVPAGTRHGDIYAREAALERASAFEALQRQSPGRQVTALMTSSDDALWSFWYAQFVLNRARGVQTPWGVPLRQRQKQIGWDGLVGQWQRRGPVACTFFYPEVDKRFPLVPLSPDGLLWLASRRTLPLPATPISNIEYSKSAGKTILGAHFPTSTMRRDSLAASTTATSKMLLAHIKRENMTMLTLDFRAPFANPLSPTGTGAPTTDASGLPVAQQIGQIQMLVAPEAFFVGSPSPTQQAVREEDAREPSPLATEARRVPFSVTEQTLRLVVPQGTRVGQALRAQLPLQISGSRLGRHDLWMRLVRHQNDRTTSWTKAATIEVTNS